MANRTRLSEEEAKYLNIKVRYKDDRTRNPRYTLSDKKYNDLINYRLQKREFIEVQRKYNINGEVTSRTEKLQQKKLVEVPKDHELIRLSTNTTTGQQWFITKPKKEAENEPEPEDLLKLLQENTRPYEIEKKNGTGKGVYLLADFHMGAYVGKLIKTPDFNFGIIEGYLNEVANIINSKGFDKVYIGLLGDFIESFTGLNHKDSWKGLHKNADGVKAIKLAHEILKKNIYTKINNIEWIGFVSGNHDRTSEKPEGDQFGGVAEMLQYLCEIEFNFKSEWNPLLISKEIDGINYILTHGHLGLSKTEIAQIIFQYGKQGLYNVFAKGHRHISETKKTYEKKIIFEKIEIIGYTTADYRAVTVGPLFTGNFYSESNGWTSLASFVEFVNNGRGKVNFTDYTI
jgi:predicted phosphodiesterase